MIEGATLGFNLLSGTLLTVLSFGAAREVGAQLTVRKATYWLPTLFAVCAAAICARHITGVAPAMHLSIVFMTATVCSWTDLQCGLIFDRVLIFAATIFVCHALLAHTLGIAAQGAGAAAAVPLGIYLLSGGRAMGFGDVKLAGLLGFATTPLFAAWTIDVAYVLGAVVAAGLIVAGKRGRSDTMPFAPFLALGSMCSFITGAA